MTNDNTALLDTTEDEEAFSPQEKLLAMLFGPTPSMIEKLNNRLTKLSEDEQRAYGERVATAHLSNPAMYHLSADDFVAAAEQGGITVPDTVKQAVYDTVAAAPRLSFADALERSKQAAADPANADELGEFNEQETTLPEEELYQNGFDNAKQFQRGWNTSQFNAEEVITLAEAEGGKLAEATKRGIRDAYAHYTVSNANMVTA